MSFLTLPYLRSIALLSMAAFFLIQYFSGRLAFYINERFFTLSLLAAVFLLVLGLVSWPGMRKAQTAPACSCGDTCSCGHDHDHGPDCEHDHDHDHAPSAAQRWSVGVLMLPIILGVLVPMRSLGVGAIETKGLQTSGLIRSAESAQTFRMELPSDQRSIIDWIVLFNGAEDASVHQGERADVIGFVYRQPGLQSDEFMVARFTLSCCVADAYAIGMKTRWAAHADLRENTWVRVKGTVEVDSHNGIPVPLLIAESVQEVPEPGNPYLYP
jgi:putative membrane protein